MTDEPTTEALKPPKQPSKRSLTWERIEDNLIRYLPNKKYYIQSKLKGVRVRECLNTTNLREAQVRIHSRPGAVPRMPKARLAQTCRWYP